MTTSNDPDGDIEVIDLASRVASTERTRRLVPPSERSGQGQRRRISADGTMQRSPLWYLGAGVLVVLLWAVVAAWSVLQIRADVAQAQQRLEQAESQLTSGDLEQAADGFGEAADTLGGVRTRARSPLVWPVRMVPGYRRTLDAVGGLGDASADVAASAEDVVRALAGGGGLGSLTPRDGRLPLEEISALVPLLDAAAMTVDGALVDIRDVNVRGVDQAVVDGRQQLLDVLGPASDGIRAGLEMAEVLPVLFGADGPRRYLVLASNPTENRGTGGFFGAFSVVEADDGVLTFGDVGETVDLPLAERGEIQWPDPSLEARWGQTDDGDFYGDRSFRQMNLTPDFPSAALIMEQYWAEVMGEELDGVIAVDPFAFEALLGISGPVDLGEDLPVIGPDRVVEFVSYDAYGLIEDPAERKRLIGEVAAATLQGFLNGPGDVSPGQVLEVLGDMVQRDSLLIHAARPDEQQLLVDVGLSGTFQVQEGTDLLSVKLNNQAGSKVDYFLRRTLRHDVELLPDGVTSSIVSAGFENTAPSEGELQYMIGPDLNGFYEPGANVSYVSVYCAPGCAFGEVPDLTEFQGVQLPTVVAEELGFGVASSWMLLPSLAATELVYSYELPGGWRADGADRVYTLRYDHQTAVTPTTVRVNVRIPRGFEAIDLPEGAQVVDRRVELAVDASRDFIADFRFTPLD